MSREHEPPTTTDRAFDMAEDTFAKICRAYSFTSNYLQLESKLAAGKVFASDHPLITLFLILALAMCSIPVLCFLTFAVGSVCLMFTSFIFIEGVMLSVGLFILLGILCVVSCFALGASVVIGVTGYIYLYLRNKYNQFIYGYDEEKRNGHIYIESHEE